MRYMIASKNEKLDFSNTEIAFSYKSDSELKKAAWLFSFMNRPWLVNAGSKLGMLAVKWNLPFTESTLKATVFEHFVGGTTLLDSMRTIEKLYQFKIQSILDYGAEGKDDEQDLNHTMNENIRAIEFAAKNESTPVISTKISGLARNELLEKIQASQTLSKEELSEYRVLVKRLDAICHAASEKNVKVFIDAEESWIQDSIDHLVELMMYRYNKGRVIVYNTFQLYRRDRLQYLMDSFDRAEKNAYMLGAKIVRGAYMEKERERADEMGYPSPIHPNKAATDDAFNTAVRFLVDNYKKIASCNATHNVESCLLQANLIQEKNIPKGHPHLNFCQLYGMSDHITFNLAQAGYNVAKYVVYGSVKELVPYLIRRAQENTAISGEMSRELNLIQIELRRRGIK